MNSDHSHEPVSISAADPAGAGAGSASSDSATPASSPFIGSHEKPKFNFKFVMAAQLLTLLIAAIMLSPGVSMAFYNNILFYADKKSYEQQLGPILRGIDFHYHTHRQTLSIKTPSGETLDAWYYPMPKSTKLVLISHGNAGNIAYRLPVIKVLLDCNVSVLMYDYEGYGQSTGSPSLDKIAADGLAAFDYARDTLHYQPKDIIDMGESLGTGVAGYIASHRDPGAILLVSGMTSIIDAGKSKIMWLNLYPDSVFPQPTFDNLSIARGKHAPLLLVHGEADNLLTCDFSRRMFSEGSQPKQLLIVKNTGHNDMFKDENMAPLAKALQTWIAQIDNLQKINQSLSSAALK